MTRVYLLAAVVALTPAVPAVAAPPEVKPKPRPALVGTLKVADKVTQVVWSPDGKHLVLLTDKRGMVVGRDQLGEDATPTPLSEFDLPAGELVKAGFTPDGSELYAVAAAGPRVNAETRLCYWAVRGLLAGGKKAKPDRVVKLDADNPIAFAFADGKSAVAVVSEPREGPVVLYSLAPRAGKVVRVDAKTGDVTDTLVELSDPDDTLVGATAHPASGRVFAHFHSSDSVVRCVDAGTRKARWERVIEGNGGHQGSACPVVAPDGSVLAVGGARPVQLPQWNGAGQPMRFAQFQSFRMHLLDGDTGKPIADLGADDAYNCRAGGFSADGRLLFGWVSRHSGTQYTVWEARSGKVLKVWDRQSNDVTAGFAHAGHDLAIVERTQAQVLVVADADKPPSSGEVVVENPHQLNQYGRITRTKHTSVVGVWDLAPLAK